MVAKYILASLAVFFLIAGALSPGRRRAPTWLLIGAIFALVSVYLFVHP